MSLYAIGDLHLSFTTNKPMDIFGSAWENHVEKLREGFSVLNDDDVKNYDEKIRIITEGFEAILPEKSSFEL